MLGHKIYGAMTLCFCVLFCEIPQAPNAIGVGYINAFMKNHDFAILSQGISLQYARKSESYGSLYQLNLSHANLRPSSERITSQQSTNIGFMGIYDFALPDLLEIVTYQPGDQISFRCVEKNEEAVTVTATELL